MDKTLKLLKKLTQTPAVGGAEEEIVKLLKDELSEYGEVKVDCMNNITCTFGEGVHILLDAHIDEIGLIVTSITEDGFIKFTKCGGIDTRMLCGYEVTVWGEKPLHGIISTKAVHLQKSGDDKKVADIDDLSIDLGLSFDEINKIVSPGDRITFKRNFTPLLNNQVSASCLDDRAGVAAILLALEKVKNTNAKITVLFSSQEELGTRGAKVGGYDKSIDAAICVDVSFAYSPGCKSEECGDIGSGVMIGVAPVLNKNMSNDLIKIAKENKIPHQLEIMGGTTSSNADVISVLQTGIPTAFIAVPQKYMHSPVEVVNTKDVEAVANLIAEYINYRAGENNA